MERVGWSGILHPEGVDEYVAKHQEIWPEMVQMLSDVGFRNYSIFVLGNQVFGRYETKNAEASIQGQRDAAIRQDWSRHMQGLFASDGTTRMREVMFLPGDPD